MIIYALMFCYLLLIPSELRSSLTWLGPAPQVEVFIEAAKDVLAEEYDDLELIVKDRLLHIQPRVGATVTLNDLEQYSDRGFRIGTHSMVFSLINSLMTSQTKTSADGNLVASITHCFFYAIFICFIRKILDTTSKKSLAYRVFGQDNLVLVFIASFLIILVSHRFVLIRVFPENSPDPNITVPVVTSTCQQDSSAELTRIQQESRRN